MAQEKFLSLNAMEKIMKQVGAPRVAESAKEALAEVLEEKAKEISLEAKKYAEHAGRRTVTADDIKLAIKQ